MPKRNNGCPRCGGPNTLVSVFVVCGKCGHRRGQQQLSRSWASGGGDPALFMDIEPPRERFPSSPRRPLTEEDQ
jgi:hypothetical protein